MLVRIVGLGPGDSGLLTIGALDAMRSIGRAVTLLAPPDLTAYLSSHGVEVLRPPAHDAGTIVRGAANEIQRFVETLPAGDLAIGVLGNPLSDFPGLALLLDALERRGARTEMVSGMRRRVLEFCDGEIRDDMTVLALRVAEPPDF